MTTPFSVTVSVTDNITGEVGTQNATFNVNGATSTQALFGVYDPSLDGSGSWSGVQPFEAAPVKIGTHYVQWDLGTLWPSSFATLCQNNNAIPFVELEPWNSATGGKTWPTFANIIGGTYDSLLTGLGSGIASFGHTVWLTFAHEMNGSWYPWGNGGAGGVTPSQWISAWKHVHDTVNSTAGGLAKWVWAPNNNDVGPVTPYWPGASYVDIPAADMYIQNSSQTFANFHANTIREIATLTSTPVWNAETGVNPADATQPGRITQFVSDMKNAGMSGFMWWNQSPYNISGASLTALTNAVNAWNAS